MSAASSPTWPARRRADAQLGTLLSVPDMESLDEITDRDVQELLAMASSPGSNHRHVGLIGEGAAGEDGHVASHTAAAVYKREEPPAQQQRRPCDSPSAYTAALPFCASPPHDSMLSPMADEPRNAVAPISGRRMSVASLLPPPAPFLKADTLAEKCGAALAPQSRTPSSSPSFIAFGPPKNTQDSRAVHRGRSPLLSLSPPASPGPPRLVPISDTELLEAERHRWESQLVQECWFHQELHGARWDHELLLQHGAAYRPRAIASRTAVSMTHSKRLCIALNVETSIVEKAEGAFGDEKSDQKGGGGGGAEAVGLPSMSSPQAEAWAPLFMWRSPAFILGDSSAVLAQLSERLGEQYEGLAARPLQTMCCANARPSDLIQTLSDARKDAGDAKVIFHYVARGVPPPRGGNLYLINMGPNAAGYGRPPYSKLSLETFRSRVGFPLVFVADCAEAGEILDYYIHMCEEQHQQCYFTSSREYQLKLSRHVSTVELDTPADSEAILTNSGPDRADRNLDMALGDSFRHGSRFGAGGIDAVAPSQRAVLQDFYFIGATGSTGGGNGGSGTNGSNAARSRMGPGRGDAAASGVAGGGRFMCDADAGALRHHLRLPSDILTSCLTTPLRMAILWFIAERPELQALHPLILHLFPGTLKDRKTPLGQLQWYLQSIIECIAWSTLSLPQYSRLFREDVYVAPLFRGYLLAERIIVGGLGGCLSVYPPVPAMHSHTLWGTWDNVVERACVSLLRAVRPTPPHCASVLEFRSWLDVQLTSWRYSRPDLLAVAAGNNVLGSAGPPGADTHGTRLPSLPDGATVVMPSFLSEELRGLQAILDGITQQSFERPRAYLAGVWGLQLRSSTSVAAWGSGTTAAGGADSRDDAEEDGRGRRRRHVSPTVGRAPQDGSSRGAAARVVLRGIADQYSNSLRSSYPPAPQQQPWGAVIPPSSPTLVRDCTRHGAIEDSSGRASTRNPNPQRQPHPTSTEAALVPSRGRAKPVDSRVSVAPRRYQGASRVELTGGLNASNTTLSTVSPSGALSGAVVQRTASHLTARKTEYMPNLFTSFTTSGQAASLHYTAGFYRPAEAVDSTLFLGNPYSSTTAAPTAAASPVLPLQHTFPFMERMPLLLQALLVASHREKATELMCRLVDCGPAAVLQCAEANIYRFVLDRYWNRPDLRFLMPATLFIYCKSCYADPELIGSDKQRDVAVKVCAEILQCPVEVPPSTSLFGGDEAPGVWQRSVLGPYSTPYGQRMMAASLLTLVALHSDGGREVCHLHGVFQLCCQLLQRAQEEAPLWRASTEASVASGTTAAAPLIPRVPFFSQKPHVSLPSPPCLQHRATPRREKGNEPLRMAPPPASMATTYYLTLLTLFVSLLCSWKLPAAANDATEKVEGDVKRGEGVHSGRPPGDTGSSSFRAAPLDPPALHPLLDGTVHEVPPTSAEVLEASLSAAAPALFHFVYSDTSVLRGAAQRCLTMVLISPAPSQASRALYAECQLHRLYGVPVSMAEINTDLRLEGIRMAYTVYRWLFAQICEDIPVEEIGHYVAQWMYRWFRLAAKGKPPPAPFIFGDKDLGKGGAQKASLDAYGSNAGSPPPPHHSVWTPSTVSFSYRGPAVVTPGSVHWHHRHSALVPATRSFRVGLASDPVNGEGMGSLSLGGGLRQHITQQDHRRLQAYLPPLSNLVRLFFEYTQDACPYVRAYGQRVVLEELSFLRHSWYDDYTVLDHQHLPSPPPVPGEHDYTGAGRHHHPSHQRRRRYTSGSGQSCRHGDRHYFREGEPKCCEKELKAASGVVGGEFTTCSPPRHLAHVRGQIDDHAGGGVAEMGFETCTTGASPAPVLRDFEASNCGAGAAAPSVEDIEDVAEPHPAVLRRFIMRLFRIASSNNAEGATGFPMSPPRPLCHYRSGPEDAVGREDNDQGCDNNDDGDSDGTESQGECRIRLPRYKNDAVIDQNGLDVCPRTCGAGDNGVGPQTGGSYFASSLRVDSESSACGGGVASMLLDAEVFGLYPLWTLDSATMTTFAYGALSFLERFMLEEMDDSDPRHPINLEKENALYEYSQRVERSICASARNAAGGLEAECGCGREPLPVARDGGQLNKTAGSVAHSSAATRPCSLFQCIGIGDIGRAGVPGCVRRGSVEPSSSSPHSLPMPGGGGLSAAASSPSRVAGHVNVILFHPSEPVVVTSTTGGLVSVWSYEAVEGIMTDEMNAARDAFNGVGSKDDDERSAAARGPLRSLTSSSSCRVLEVRAQYYLRDVVRRTDCTIARVPQSRYMFDRHHSHGPITARRAGGIPAAVNRELEARRSLRSVYGTAKATSAGAYRPAEASGLGGGDGGSRPGAWMERAEAANAAAALSSAYKHGNLPCYHGAGDMHFIDAAYRPLLCAVQRTGSVEVFSDFADHRQVRRVTTFETMSQDQRGLLHHCVSSYQPPTGLLYVSTTDGGVNAWDLGSEQRLALSGRLASVVEDAGGVSALAAHPCTPYEYVVGHYNTPVCVFDLRGGANGAARCGVSLPSFRYHIKSCLVSPFCLRVSYSLRYPNTVVAGYADGAVAVWDRRYTRQPCILFGAELESPCATKPISSETRAASTAVPRTIRHLDTHPSSKRFLTLTTTSSSLQLVQPWRDNGRATLCDTGGTGGFHLFDEGLHTQPKASLLHRFPLDVDVGEDATPSNGGGGGGGSGPGAACFHDFSPLLGVGVGSSLRLYGTPHLTSPALCLESDRW